MLKEFADPRFAWGIIGIILLLMELFLPGVVIMFFGLGALVVSAICFFVPISINMQLFIFLVSSIALLVFLRKWVKTTFHGFFKGQDPSVNLDDFVGKTVQVTEDIKPMSGGRVELNGTSWKASAVTEIPKGTTVKILAKENLTLKVEKA